MAQWLGHKRIKHPEPAAFTGLNYLYATCIVSNLLFRHIEMGKLAIARLLDGIEWEQAFISVNCCDCVTSSSCGISQFAEQRRELVTTFLTYAEPQL